MSESKTWLDRLVQRFCEWLNDRFPGQGGLAVVGSGLAGLRGVVSLPVDRRLEHSARMAHDNWMEKANGYSAKGGNALENDCGFWAYCHISGFPCVWCGGSNSLLPGKTKDLSRLCPKGKATGQAWFGCCTNPRTGQSKLIAFADCCQSSDFRHICKFRWPCRKWTGAKNWCTYQSGTVYRDGAEVPVYGEMQYYCTVVIDTGRDDTCS